jgi:preprotein translocase subunit Sss1
MYKPKRFTFAEKCQMVYYAFLLAIAAVGLLAIGAAIGWVVTDIVYNLITR